MNLKLNLTNGRNHTFYWKIKSVHSFLKRRKYFLIRKLFPAKNLFFPLRLNRKFVIKHSGMRTGIYEKGDSVVKGDWYIESSLIWLYWKTINPPSLKRIKRNIRQTSSRKTVVFNTVINLIGVTCSSPPFLIKTKENDGKIVEWKL